MGELIPLRPGNATNDGDGGRWCSSCGTKRDASPTCRVCGAKNVADPLAADVSGYDCQAVGEHQRGNGERDMADLTAAARLERAEQIVGEQRDPHGEYGALGHPEYGPFPVSAVEAFYIQEIERLQRAVMGEPEPDRARLSVVTTPDRHLAL